MPQSLLYATRLTAAGLMILGWHSRAVAEIDLTPAAEVAQFTHITAELEVGGHLVVAGDEAKREEAATEDRQLPLSVHATVEFDQWRVPAELASKWVNENVDAELAIRRYLTAEAVIKVDQGGHKPTLSPNRRVVLVRQLPAQKASFYCPDGPFEREQLDLIDVVGNPLALDDVLPTKPIGETESWKPGAAAMAALLGLDSVAVCEVESVIDKTGNKYAQVRMAGAVHGTIDGAATEMELQAVYLFDHQSRSIEKFNLAIKEKRSIGHATPGLDVVAKLKLTIKPISTTEQLDKAALTSLESSGHLFKEVLCYHGRRQGFRVEHDPQWFVTSEDREAVTLRRIEDGDLVAHCTINRLPAAPEGQATSLDQFQKDVQFSLRNNFGHFVKTREWTSELGHHCYCVVARGTVEEVPVEWRYYLIAPETGHRASVAFTVEERMVERLGEGDRALVDTLELIEPETTEPTEPVAQAEEAEPTVEVGKPTRRTENRSSSARRVNRRRGGIRRR